MGFIKDSFNTKLFLLIVLTGIAMVSLAVITEKHFKEINARYENKVKELDNTFNNLAGAQVRLNETIEDLEITGLREESIKDKYNELKSERDKLMSERSSLLNQIDSKDQKIEKLERNLAFNEEEIDDLNDRANKLKSRIDCFESGNANC